MGKSGNVKCQHREHPACKSLKSFNSYEQTVTTLLMKTLDYYRGKIKIQNYILFPIDYRLI